MKKRIFLLILAVILCLSACVSDGGGKVDDQEPNKDQGNSATKAPNDPTEEPGEVIPDHDGTDTFMLDEAAAWIEMHDDGTGVLVGYMSEEEMDADDLKELGLTGERAVVSFVYRYSGKHSEIETQEAITHRIDVDKATARLEIQYSDVAALREALLAQLGQTVSEKLRDLISGKDVDVTESMMDEKMAILYIMKDNAVTALELFRNDVRYMGYEFYANGNTKISTEYSGGDTIEGVTEYYENGNRKCSSYFYGNGMLEYYAEYNEYGDWISRIEYEEDGSVDERETATWEYYDDGNPKSTTYYYDGVLSEITEYYENGMEKKSTQYYSDGTVEEVWEYNENGDLLVNVEYDEDGTRIDYCRYEYTYAANGDRQSKKAYDAYGNLVENSQYVDGTLILSERYDSNGTLLSREQYNTNGRTVREEYYDPDYGTDPYELYIYEYYEDGTRKNRSYYYAGVLSTYNEYHTNGSRSLTENYDDNGDLARRRTYEENGNLLTDGYYDSSYGTEPYNLELYEYYESGELKNRQEQRYGLLYQQFTYHENGELQCQINYYENGNKCSRWQFDEDGTQTSSEYFYENGKLQHKMTFHDGENIHEEWAYDENGTLREYYQFDSYGGLLKDEIYDENGNLIP